MMILSLFIIFLLIISITYINKEYVTTGQIIYKSIRSKSYIKQKDFSGLSPLTLEYEEPIFFYFLTLKFIIFNKIIIKEISVSEITYSRLNLKDKIRIKIITSYFYQFFIKKIVII